MALTATAPSRPRRPAPAAGTAPLEVPFTPGRWTLDARRALALPLAFVAVLAAMGLLPSVRQQPTLWWSFLGAAALLAAWAALLMAAGQRRGRQFVLEVVLRKQHYLQACAHLSIFAYWGWYWREVYHSAHLIAAQLLFAYAFDILLAWSRRETYTLGFGPFPIIFSTNLFLWFKPEWFYFQFAMVAIGFAAKELIRWQKDGRQVHVFNPSSFPLFIASLALILTGSTSMTWGQEIASTFELPPYIRTWIFLIGLPGQFLFGVVTMTMSAVFTVCGFGLVYHWIFGGYYFVDAFIPAAVFLGMHLLFTDPSTSPRSELGRLIFGVLYGLAVVALFGLLGQLGVPTFYDKLLAVPALNLTIQFIDRFVASGALRAVDPTRLGRSLAPRQRNLVYIAIWALGFVAMMDPADAYRPRRWVPFWQQACTEGRRNGCDVLSKLEARYCNDGSGWACNELGILAASGRAAPVPAPVNAFGRACSLGTREGCENAAAAQGAQAASAAAGMPAFRQAPPQPADYPILLQEGRGRLDGLPPAELFEAACHQGWADGCNRLASVHYYGQQGAPRDVGRAVAALLRGCELKAPRSCADAGIILLRGDGVPSDPERGRAYLKRACDEGFRRACSQLGPAASGNAGG